VGSLTTAAQTSEAVSYPRPHLIRRVFALSILTLCALPVGASSFSGSLDIAVVFSLPRDTGLMENAPAVLVPGCLSFAVGNASATCDLPQNEFGADTLFFSAGPVKGTAGLPSGVAFADSFGTSSTIRVFNGSGSDNLVGVGVTWTVDLEVAAGNNESADASYSFSILGLGAGLRASKDLPCNACGTDSYSPTPSLSAAFSLNVPAHGFRDVTIDPDVQGFAAVPEPAPWGLVLTGAGLFGLIAGRKR
jgi:hypothetical protein